MFFFARKRLVNIWLGRANLSKTGGSASERKGNTLKRLKDFQLKAKARIWH